MKNIRLLLGVIIFAFSVSACLQFQVSQVNYPTPVPPTDTLLPTITSAPIHTNTLTPTTSLPTATLTPTQLPTMPEKQVINLANSTRLKEIGKVFQSEPYRVVWTVDGLYFAVISRFQVILFNSLTLHTTAAFTIQEPTQLLDFSPDGLTAAVTSDQESIKLWNVIQNKLIKTINPPSMFTTALFSPDGKMLLVNSMDEFAACLYDVNTGKLIRKYTGFDTAAPIYSVSFSDNGQMIIWFARAEVQLTDIDSGQISQPFSHEDFVTSFAVSPNNQLLVTSVAATVDGILTPTIQLWDTATGSSIGYILTKNMALDLVFSKDGKMLAAANGQTLVLFDVVQKKQILSFEGHSDSISSLSFSPDGTILATTSFDNSVRLWQIK